MIAGTGQIVYDDAFEISGKAHRCNLAKVLILVLNDNIIGTVTLINMYEIVCLTQGSVKHFILFYFIFFCGSEVYAYHDCNHLKYYYNLK